MNTKLLDVPLSDLTFVAFDTETTGREPTRARLLEVAAVRAKLDLTPGGTVGGGTTPAGAESLADADRYQRLARPDTLIPLGATRTHGISEEDVRDCARAGEVIRDFCSWLADCGEQTVLIAHNAGFDLELLSYECARAGVPVPTLFSLDTLVFTRRSLPGLPGYSLEALCRGLQLRTGRFHRALDDARITLDLFRYCAEKSLGPDRQTLGAALDVVGDPQFFRATGELSAEQRELIDTLRDAIENKREVDLEVKKGGGSTRTTRVKPLAAYPAPEGATACAYVDVPGDTEEGISLMPLEQVVQATVVTGGQGLLFG